MTANPSAQDPSAWDQRLLALENEIGRLSAIDGCTQLMNKYGYMLDKCYYDEICDLFATDDVAVPEVYHDGTCYVGHEGVRRFYEFFKRRHGEGNNGPADKEFVDHPITQHVITVLPGNQRAYGRSRILVQMVKHKDKDGGPVQVWAAGIYENQFLRVDGQWKFVRLNMNINWATGFDEGWAHVTRQPVPPPETLFPDDPFGPDRFVDHGAAIWPGSTATFPFHFVHPVTGKPILDRLPTGQSDWPASE